MQSLEVKTCLSLVKDLSLREILEFVDSKSSSNVNRICDSSEFWRAVIDRFYGKVLLQQRMDVDERDLKLFASSLASGVKTVYGVVINLGTNPESKVSDHVEIESIDDESLLTDGDDLSINFEIRGLRPSEGSVGYLADYSFVIDGRAETSSQECFSVGKPENLHEAELSLKYHFAIKTYNAFMSVKTEADNVNFFNLNYKIVSVGQDDIQTKTEFVKLFLTQSLKTDPNLATELFLALTDNLDIWVQIWVVQIKF